MLDTLFLSRWITIGFFGCLIPLTLPAEDSVDHPPIVISEFLAINESGLKDDEGDLVDWIELYNPGSDAFDLGGCYLTDDADQLTQWRFPSMTLASGEHLLVYASGKDRPDQEGALHTNFSLNGNGEFLALVAADGTRLLHAVEPAYPNQKKNVSYGLVPEWRTEQDASEWMDFLLSPTPGTSNAGAAAGKVNVVKLSHDPGFYDASFDLKMKSSTKGARIRYTTDGSVPSEDTGAWYSGPLRIEGTTVLRARAFKDGWRPSNVKTRTFLFAKDVIHQSPDGVPPPGFPYHWGGNRVDYGMDSRVVNDPAYRDEIIDGLLSIPSYSIVTDMDHLFDMEDGIYANAHEDGRQWERPASVELIHSDGQKGFQIDCGIRIRGGFSRTPENAKHAFRLFFRDEYGPSKLRYPLFGDDGAESYDNLDLRCSSNYSWSIGGDHRAALLRDQINRDLQAALGHPAMRGYFCHVYINGHYWGLYNTCERPKAGHGASYFKGKKEDFDAVKVSKEGGIMATDGTLDAWRRVYEIAREGLADNEAYFKLQGRLADGRPDPEGEVLIDIDNVIDYAMVIFYGGNLDAAITWFGGNRWHNNWHALRNRHGKEGFKFFIWDAEHTFLVDGMSVGLHEDRTGPFPAGQEFESSNPQWLWQQCLDNREFRMRAADRIYELYHAGGRLTPEAVRALVQKRVSEIRSAVICESARWGNTSRPQDPPMTRDEHWNKEIDRILNVYIPQRSDIVLGQLFRQGILPGFEPAALERLEDGHVKMTAAEGTVYYTEDGSDPRALGGAVSPSAKQYAQPFKPGIGRSIKARVQYRGEWSVLTQIDS